VDARNNPRGGLRAEEGPDNQQERLIAVGWVLGFVDGEGCFSIGLIRQPDRDNRKGYRTGFQVSHEFAVTQGEKSVASLLALREFFDVGGLSLISGTTTIERTFTDMSFANERIWWER
jgi:hypothetical protein